MVRGGSTLVERRGMNRNGVASRHLGFGSVRRATRLLQHSARYFRETGIPIRGLAARSAAARLMRFLAFMLPFKVLMFMVADRSVHLAGYVLAPVEVAAILLAFAMTLFLVQLYLTAAYDKRIGAVFGDAGSDQAVEELMHHGQEVRTALASVINLRAASFLGGSLLAANIIMFPASLLLLLPMAGYIVFVVYAMTRPSYEKSLVPAEYNSIVGFLSMISVLTLLGSTVLSGTTVHFALALFVFISFRYITNCLTEITSILYRYRLGVMPSFLRMRIADHVKADFKVAGGPPPFLSTAKKNEWIRSALDAIGVQPCDMMDAVWNHSSGTQSLGFVVSFANLAPVLVNIFHPSGKAAFLQEQAVHADFIDCSFLLRKIGQSRMGQFPIVGYDLADTEPLKQEDLQACRQTLTIEMLKAQPPQLPRMKTASGDLLRWLTHENFDILRAVSPDRESIELVDWLEFNGPELRHRTLALPLALYVPSMQSSQMCRHKDGTIKLMSWNGADLEPIGGGLGPSESRRSLSISDLLADLKASREDCKSVTVDDVEISAHLFAVARYVKRRDWTRVYAAIDALRKISEKQRSTVASV